MAVNLVSNVVEALNAAGIPAQTAYPGTALPGLTGAVAAVRLQKLEYTARSGVVEVTVASPSRLGAAVCEDAAVRVAQVLEGMGGVCVQEGSGFHGYADAYQIRVLATFHGSAVMPQWERTTDFSVKLNETPIPRAVGFRAEQAVDDEGVPLSSAVWTFRLEEMYGWGDAPPPPPTGTFTVTVTRSSGLDQYENCIWTAIELEDTATGLRQIRTGVAEKRSFLVIT